MPQPADDPVWATDANYPAGAEPEAGTPTKVEPSAGKQAIGHRPSEFPPAQYLNWWMNLVYLWVVWLKEQVASAAKWVDVAAGAGVLTRFSPEALTNNWFGDYVPPNVCSVVYYVHVPEGTQIDGVRMRHYGTGSNTASITLYRNIQGGGGIGTIVFQAASGVGGEPATSPAAWQTMTKTGAAHTTDTSNGSYYTLVALFNEPNVKILSLGFRIAASA